MTCGVRGRRACPRTRRKGPTANGADRRSRSDHSGTTQQGAQQPPATENLRETNVELRRRAKGREPKDQSRKPHQYILRGSMSALSFPKLPGDVKD